MKVMLLDGGSSITSSMACQLVYRSTKEAVVKPLLLADLRAKLSDPQHYFTSYKQIQQWLQESYGISLKYSWVHEIVRYQLGAKLEVVRKSNVKKNVAYEQKFKKK